jgi:hypothetical protein
MEGGQGLKKYIMDRGALKPEDIEHPMLLAWLDTLWTNAPRIRRYLIDGIVRDDENRPIDENRVEGWTQGDSQKSLDALVKWGMKNPALVIEDQFLIPQWGNTFTERQQREVDRKFGEWGWYEDKTISQNVHRILEKTNRATNNNISYNTGDARTAARLTRDKLIADLTSHMETLPPLTEGTYARTAVQGLMALAGPDFSIYDADQTATQNILSETEWNTGNVKGRDDALETLLSEHGYRKDQLPEEVFRSISDTLERPEYATLSAALNDTSLEGFIDEAANAYREEQNAEKARKDATDLAKNIMQSGRHPMKWTDIPLDIQQFLIDDVLYQGGVIPGIKDGDQKTAAEYAEGLRSKAYQGMLRSTDGREKVLDQILDSMTAEARTAFEASPDYVSNTDKLVDMLLRYNTIDEAINSPEFSKFLGDAIKQGFTSERRAEYEERWERAEEQAKDWFTRSGIDWSLLNLVEQQGLIGEFLRFGDFDVGRTFAEVMLPEDMRVDPETGDPLPMSRAATFGQGRLSYVADIIKDRTADKLRDAPAGLIEEIAKSRNILNSGVSDGFLDYFHNSLIPRIRTRLSLIDPDDTEAVRAEIKRQFDAMPVYERSSDDYDRQLAPTARDVLSGAALPPGVPGGPGFRLARPTPVFDITAFTPKLQTMAMERPELAKFIQNQMQVPGFEQDWQQAAKRKVTRDRGAEISLQDNRVASFQAAHDRAISAREDRIKAVGNARENLRQVEAVPGATDASINAARSALVQAESALRSSAGGITRAEAALADAQARAARETGAAFPVYETYTGTRYDPKTQRIVEAERARLAEGVSTTGIRQKGFIKVDITQLEGETDEAFRRRYDLEQLRVDQNLRDMAKMKTTAGLTQREFFEKQLPGFEKRFEASPFFQMEQDRLEREKEIEETRAEEERRRATSRGAVTMFGRRQ